MGAERHQGRHSAGPSQTALLAGAAAERARAVLRRIPPRPLLWGGIAGCWAIATILPGTGWWSALEAALICGGCLAGITRLNRAEQRQWRETRGRMNGQARTWQDATERNSGRIGDLEGRIGDLEALVHELAAGQAARDSALVTAFGYAGVKPPATRGHLAAVPGTIRGA